jgi:hypothetical protein
MNEVGTLRCNGARCKRALPREEPSLGDRWHVFDATGESIQWVDPPLGALPDTAMLLCAECARHAGMDNPVSLQGIRRVFGEAHP